MTYISPIITPINSPYLNNKNTGLGNCLFQIASVYGISKKLNINCAFPNVKIYCEKLKKLFGFNHYDTILRNICNNFNEGCLYQETYDNKLNRIYDENMIKYLSNVSHNITIYGYLECTKYFNDYRNDILNLFSIDTNSESYIQNKYGHILNTNKVVSIHFRCGYDYLHHYNPYINFYKKAIEYFIKKYENPHFFLFSDNIGYINLNQLGLINNYTIIENNQDYIDLWTMSKCDGHIISPSTFSFWGVYLNQKENIDVLYDKQNENKYELDYSFTNNYIGI